MKIGSAKPRSSGTLDMVPMINFAFLLLIFVIIVGAIAAPDLLAVQPPRSQVKTQQQIEPDTVIIDAHGQVAFGGEVLEPDALLARVQTWKTSAGDRPLVVKADAQADAERIVVILEVLRAAGVAHARLMTMQRGS
jgi:biopolymer transport protein ExbD